MRAIILIYATLLGCVQSDPKIVVPPDWKVGEKVQVGLSSFPNGSCVRFSSSDSMVVSISGNGIAESHSVGTVQLRALTIRCPGANTFVLAGDTVTVVLEKTRDWRGT